MTLDQAKELIEEMKCARPTCERCQRLEARVARDEWRARHSLQSGAGCPGLHQYMVNDGWTADIFADVFIKRCAQCAATKVYPWADRLDPQRVVEFCGDRSFIWYALQQTLVPERRGFEFL